MGYGIDDFMSSEKRRLPIFDWFEKGIQGEGFKHVVSKC
jgi:hypothetical protein